MAGRVDETYAAALQHGYYTVEGTLVGVVRRPTGWFHALVDENRPALGPPDPLLTETKERQKDLELTGMCNEGAHNAAWEETDFESRYLEYLEDDPDARAQLDTLALRVRKGEDITLVCFEGDGKRCHRRLLRDWIADLA